MCNKIREIKNETTTVWENSKAGQMVYDEKKNLYQFIRCFIEDGKYQFEIGRTERNFENCPIVAKGIVAYFLRNFGISERKIFEQYYKESLKEYESLRSLKPGSSILEQDPEFYSKHWEREKRLILFSKKIEPFLNRNEINIIEVTAQTYLLFIEQQYGSKESDAAHPKSTTVDENTDENINSKEPTLRDQIQSFFGFMLSIDPRKHKKILSDEDFISLVDWIELYFMNDEKPPLIKNPINKANTNKTNIIFSFKEFYKLLYPNKTYPDSLFELIKLCFYQHRNDNIENHKKQGEPQYYRQLINISK